MALGAFGSLYLENLQGLKTNDLNKIKLMRDLAKENPRQAQDVLKALCQHITSCPEVQRLPALYVMDLILKTAGAPYPALIHVRIPEVFATVWDRAKPDLRPKLVKLANSWREQKSLPEDILSIVMQKMQPSSPPPVPVVKPQAVLYPPSTQAPTLPQSAIPTVSTLPAQQLASIIQLSGAQPVLVNPQALGALQLPAPLQQAQLGGAILNGPVMNHPTTASAILANMLQQAQVGATVGQPAMRTSTGSGGSAGNAPQDGVQAAISALFEGTRKTKSQFYDHQLKRNQRLQEVAHLVRPWFVHKDQWLEGSRDVSQMAPAVPFGEEEMVDATAGVLPLVEEDPSQPSCAVSGEAFERTYDPNTDKWYYEDAVVVTAQQAAALGVMEGSIVKSSCLVGVNPSQPASSTQDRAQQRIVENSKAEVGEGEKAEHAGASASAGVKRTHEAAAEAPVMGSDTRLHAPAIVPEAKRVKTVG